MKAFCLAVAITLLGLHHAAAQPGRTGIGLRGSIDGTGMTAKYFFDRAFALEAQVNVGGLRAIDGQSYYSCILIEYHLQLPVPSFRIFFGGGLHAGWWASRPESDYVDEGILGLDGIGGIEYLFARLPMGISGDLRPSINYLQEVEFLPHNVIGISLRYYFGSNKAKPFEYPRQIRRRFQK
jgi:hypothetical protein